MLNPLPLAPVAASGLLLGDRKRQEDAIACAMPDGAELGFAILSDGMGGHAAGDLASQLIVSEVFAELSIRFRNFDPRGFDVPAILRRAASEANNSLQAHVLSRPAERGMGGTLVVAVIWQLQLYWLSVGDSLLYLYRDGALRRLNADHSMAPQLDLMVAKGLMEADVAASHPHRSCLMSAVIGEELTDVDCPEEPVALAPGDVLFLASDGLLTLEEADIAATLAELTPKAALPVTRALLGAVELAALPEQDNTSLITIEVPETPHDRQPGVWQRLRARAISTPKWIAAERSVT